MKRLANHLATRLALAALLVGATAAQAAAPQAVSLSSGISFAQYTGSVAVGNGRVDDDSHLFYVDERDSATERSWLIFFDPTALTQVQATLVFDRPILGVQTTRDGLAAGAAAFGVDLDGDGRLNDYRHVAGTGLESDDSLSWTAGSNTLVLDWSVAKLGDQIRVTTAVPEPATWLSMGLGLALLAAGLGRRRAR